MFQVNFAVQCTELSSMNKNHISQKISLYYLVKGCVKLLNLILTLHDINPTRLMTLHDINPTRLMIQKSVLGLENLFSVSRDHFSCHAWNEPCTRIREQFRWNIWGQIYCLLWQRNQTKPRFLENSENNRPCE